MAATIIIIVIVLGVISVVAGPLLAASGGQKMGSAFEQAYKAEFGSNPPSAATKAVSKATSVINAFLMRDKSEQRLGKERLEESIDEYGRAVSWDESKMLVGLMCMGAICMTKKGSVAPGYGWAVEIIESAMMRYCPASVYGLKG